MFIKEADSQNTMNHYYHAPKKEKKRKSPEHQVNTASLIDSRLFTVHLGGHDYQTKVFTVFSNFLQKDCNYYIVTIVGDSLSPDSLSLLSP